MTFDTCEKCGSKNSATKSGYDYYCKKCYGERNKKYYCKNKEKIAKQQKEYRKKNREKLLAYSRLDYVKAKSRIRNLLWRKTDTGKIIKKRIFKKYLHKMTNELTDTYMKRHLNKMYGLPYKYITEELIIGNREKIKFNRLKRLPERENYGKCKNK